MWKEEIVTKRMTELNIPSKDGDSPTAVNIEPVAAEGLLYRISTWIREVFAALGTAFRLR